LKEKISTVIELVKQVRLKLPKVGVRKLYELLFEELRLLGVGRDKLFCILRANKLLIQPKKRYHVTTNSFHRFKKHKNIIKDLLITRPDQVWVSDITYIGIRENPVYLALITDAYSKKIVGYNVSQSLNASGSIKALQMAISSRKNKTKPLIHHSDRGLQYCSNEYQTILGKNGIKPSMTEKYDPYENAIAERINGVLKQEFDIDKYHGRFKVKVNLVKDAINLYNNYRPHWSNRMLTPVEMHKQNKIKPRRYKKKVAI